MDITLLSILLLHFLDLALRYHPNINTHSFRIGSASAAVSAGSSDALIRIMVRWLSSCYNRYIYTSDRPILDFHTRTTDTWHHFCNVINSTNY